MDLCHESSRKLGRRSRVAMLAAILLLAGTGSTLAQQAPPAGSPAGAVCEPTPPPYVFFTRDDEVGLAMRTIWLDQFETHPDPEAASAALGRLSDAEAVVRANRETAAAYLLETLAMLSPVDDPGHTGMQPLLSLVGEDPEILAFLRELLATSVPEPPSADHVPASPRQLVRDQALAQIVSAAIRGSELAKGVVLQLLTSPDPLVRAGAVRGVYRFRNSRSLAQREMRRVLDVDDHYLLYRY